MDSTQVPHAGDVHCGSRPGGAGRTRDACSRARRRRAGAGGGTRRSRRRCADAAAVGVPAPDAAKQEALPLALDPDAQVNLNEPADQAGAPAQPRDLAAQAPEAPASARSFSSQANGPANTLVVFDTGANGAGSASTTRWRPACSPLTAGP